MDAARLIEMAPEPEKHQANKYRRPCGRPAKGVLYSVAQAAAMAAAVAIFLVVAAASTALLLALVAAARASRRYRGSRYCVPSPRRTVLSPTADLRRLPSFALPSSPPERAGEDEHSSTCAVCLEDARAGERWRAMPACRHAFHAACVDQWLARSPACPLCRAIVTAKTS